MESDGLTAKSIGYHLLIAEPPFTPTRFQVLVLLLTKRCEEQIAEVIGKIVGITHQPITSIFRKFRANSQAALLAI